MREAAVIDLAACTEFRQTVMARPPRIVHGAALLVAALVVTAVVWSALTPASLVVRAPARVRPATSAARSFASANGEQVVVAAGGRIAEVRFVAGQTVHRGDIVARLDTTRLDHEVVGLEQTIARLTDELAGIDHLVQLGEQQFAAGQARGGAEIALAAATVHEDRGRRASQLRAAQADLRNAEDDLDRVRGLVNGGAAARTDLEAAELRLTRAREAVATAQLPSGGGRIKVLERERELAIHDRAVARAQLGLDRVRKRGELEAARQRLAGLHLDLDQALVRAHLDGVITAAGAQVGDVVAAGEALCTIAPLEGLRIDAAVGPSDISQIRVGMPVRIQLDAFAVQQHGSLTGTVQAISPDAEVVGAAGGQASYYLVQIGLDAAATHRMGPLKLGMTGQVEIVTGRARLLTVLVGDLHQAISLGGR